MSPPDQPEPGEDEILAGLPRTRPQRRSARRTKAGQVEAAGAVRAPKAPPPKPPRQRPAPGGTTAEPGTETAKAASMQPLLDHPAPADLPGAPFAPPSSPGEGAREDASVPGRRPGPQDAVAATAQAAGAVIALGAGVARAILRRLPRP